MIAKCAVYSVLSCAILALSLSVHTLSLYRLYRIEVCIKNVSVQTKLYYFEKSKVSVQTILFYLSLG